MAGILVIGFVFVDIKGFAKGNYHPFGRNLGSVQFLHGGVSRNVVENIANTGTPVTFASLTEESAIGIDVTRRLHAAGADTSAMHTVKENGIGTWLVILDEHGNDVGQISCPPDTKALEELIEAEGEKLVAEADSIVLELDTSEIIDERVFALAKKYHKPVYTVVGNMSVILHRPDFVSALDCFVCNEIEAGRIFSLDLEEKSADEIFGALEAHIASLGCPSMVVTMGEKGAAYIDTRTGEKGIAPSIPTKIVDSTGAGDAFLSGVVMGLCRGYSLSKAVKAGTYLAHLAIETKESCTGPAPEFWQMLEME